MVRIKVDRDDFVKINTLLPDLFPNVNIALKEQDEMLEKLGFCHRAPCIVEIDVTVSGFYEMVDALNDLEIEAYNTPYGGEPSSENITYQKYLKYGCLYDILYVAEKEFSCIGRVKYVGKSFGVESLTNGNIYDVISVELPFIRVIDDSGEDYLYSITRPGSMEDVELCGYWEIVEDFEGVLKEHI